MTIPSQNRELIEETLEESQHFHQYSSAYLDVCVKLAFAQGDSERKAIRKSGVMKILRLKMAENKKRR